MEWSKPDRQRIVISFLVSVGLIALGLFGVLVYVCCLRSRHHGWCDVIWDCGRGSIWNLLLVAPAGLALGNMAGFAMASFGEEEKRIGRTFSAVLGGATVADLFRGQDSYIRQLLNDVASVCGAGTNGSLVLVVLAAFFPLGFIGFYVLKACFLNEVVKAVSPELMGNPQAQLKAQNEGIARDPAAAPKTVAKTAALIGQAADPSDPQKGAWGGKASDGGYQLRATVTPADLERKLGDASSRLQYYRVRLWVESTQAGGSVTRVVTFHLHPTFAQPVVNVFPEGGIAAIERLAWGAFTVGAEVKDGPKLELDLSELPDAPAEFRSR
jgi:hypothetical protein